MLINKLILDAVKPVVNCILNNVDDNYFEVTAFVKTWEQYKGYCPSDIVEQLADNVKSIDTIAQDMEWRIFEKPGLYVVDLDFKGWINTEVITIDGVQYSQYGDKKISNYDFNICQIVNAEQLSKLLDDHNNSLITTPVHISEEFYNDMLEVLPPCRWHNSNGKTFFHVSERLTGNLVAWYCKSGNDHFSFTHNANISTAKLVQIVQDAI